MESKNIKYIIICTALIMLTAGCKKDFLNKKPSTSIVQPNTLDDFQSLLEQADISRTTALGILSSDEYVYRSYAIWQSANTATERNSYIWAKDIYGGEVGMRDWSLPYKAIFYANNVLSGLDRIEISDLNRNKYNGIKGWALFVRAYSYYDLIRNFAKAYDKSTAETDLGVPLKINPSIAEILPRASVQQTYERILSDVNEAVLLLDTGLPTTNRNHPSKIAAYALMARIYLNMRDYINAELSADNCLKLYDKLLDYNSLNITSTLPFPTLNNELIYFTYGDNYSAYSSSTGNTFTVVSRNLIDLYQVNDLRLSLYFIKQSDGTYTTKRNISGIPGAQPFTGLAVDEVYLNKSECAARRNDVITSMSYLNKLLLNRYVTGQFTPLIATSPADALIKVLLERRKELVYRALRWDDLKRLNKEGANITLTRELNGEIFTLEPNSPRYVLPIPYNEINLSGIQQNDR